MTKFLRTLLIINGLIIPCVLVVFGLVALVEFMGDSLREREPQGLVVGESKEIELADSVTTVGIHYEGLSGIYNWSGSYMTVRAQTFEQERELEKVISSANNYSYGFSNTIEVLFFDENREFLRYLTNRNAHIALVDIRSDYYRDNDSIDTSYQYHLYSIAFEDSNGDDLLNNSDTHDLYISDLDGANLKQVSRNIEVVDYEWAQNHSIIRIRYKKRDDIPDEHKRIYFAEYEVATGTWREETSINEALDALERRVAGLE